MRKKAVQRERLRNQNIQVLLRQYWNECLIIKTKTDDGWYLMEEALVGMQALDYAFALAIEQLFENT